LDLFVVKFPNVPVKKSTNVNSKVGNKNLYPNWLKKLKEYTKE
jgi:hypothetical protein